MIAKHTLLYFASKFVPAIASMLAIVLYTRLLSPQEYGRYSLTIAVAMGMNAVLFQWLNLALARYIPEHKAEEQNRWLSSAVFGWACLAALTFVLMCLLPLPQWFPDVAIIFACLALLAAAQGWFDLSIRLDNIKLNPLRYGIASAVKSALALIGGLAAFYLGLGVEGILTALIFSLLLATLFQCSIWNKVRLSEVRLSLLQQMFSYGAPLTLTFLMIFFIDVSGRLFLNHYLGAHSVGIFSAAYEFTQYVIGTLLIVVHLAAFPLVMARYAEEGEAGAQLQLKTTFELVIALALPVCAGFALLAPEVTQVFLGEAYREDAAAVIPFIALALLFSVVKSYYFDYAFQLAKSTLYQLASVTIAAFSVVIANMLLIPLYGLHGAAYASCIGFAVALLMSIALGRKVFRMPSLPYAAMAQVLIATAAMAAVVALVRFEPSIGSMIFKVTAGTVMYLFVLVCFDFYQCRTRLKERYFAK